MSKTFLQAKGNYRKFIAFQIYLRFFVNLQFKIVYS